MSLPKYERPPVPPLHESGIAGGKFTENLSSVMQHLAHLLSLPSDWDSYGARPVDRKKVETALHLLEKLIVNDAPMPAIVPTSDGSIQLEWHRCGVNLEVKVVSERLFEVFFENLATGEVWEGTIQENLAPLRSLLGRLTCS